MFIPEKGKKTLPFCEKIREKAVGFTQRAEFQALVAMLIARGERKSALQCCAYGLWKQLFRQCAIILIPLANRVGSSLTTMSIRCGLATEKRLSITRLTGH